MANDESRCQESSEDHCPKKTETSVGYGPSAHEHALGRVPYS